MVVCGTEDLSDSPAVKVVKVEVHVMSEGAYVWGRHGYHVGLHPFVGRKQLRVVGVGLDHQYVRGIDQFVAVKRGLEQTVRTVELLVHPFVVQAWEKGRYPAEGLFLCIGAKFDTAARHMP